MAESTHEDNNTLKGTETGEAPTAEDYLGDGEYTSSEPILQGSPHYHNGRLITTQEELDEINKAFDDEAANGDNVVAGVAEESTSAPAKKTASKSSK